MEVKGIRATSKQIMLTRIALEVATELGIGELMHWDVTRLSDFQINCRGGECYGAIRIQPSSDDASLWVVQFQAQATALDKAPCKLHACWIWSDADYSLARDYFVPEAY